MTPPLPMKLGIRQTTHQGGPASHRRLLLGSMVFGIVASVGGPGPNALLCCHPRWAGIIDLLAWVLFSLPIALAVWMLPPCGLAPRNEPGSG